MRHALIFIVLLLAAPGCVSSSVWTKSFHYNEQKDYPETEFVEILETDPQRSHEVIALLETRMQAHTTLPELLESMRERAKELGADAVVLVEKTQVATRQQHHVNWFLGGYETTGGDSVPVLRGKAIKYR